MSEQNLSIEQAVVQLISPDNKATLTKNENGLYYDEYTGNNYISTEGGKIIPFRDPMSGGILTPKPDGTFLSESTGRNFVLHKEHFVPLYIPDNTFEPAHVDENGRLIGNNTGRSFEIDDKGTVLTPEEIERQNDSREVTKKVYNLEQEFEQQILEKFRNLGKSILDIIEDPSLTDEQRDQKIKELKDIYNQESKQIGEKHFQSVIDTIRGKNKPKSDVVESEPEPKNFPKLESNHP